MFFEIKTRFFVLKKYYTKMKLDKTLKFLSKLSG